MQRPHRDSHRDGAGVIRQWDAEPEVYQKPPAEPEPAAEPCDRDNEPPQGSIVRDRDDDPWRRIAGGWLLIGAAIPHRWHYVWDTYGPLTLVEDGTNTGAGQ